ncbi:MAG: hypothetical protein ACFFCD_06425 [Promethearchaeota archaeon]
MDDIAENFNKFKGKTVGKNSSLRKISWSELKSKYPKIHICLRRPHIFQPCESIIHPEYGEIYVVPVNNLFYQFILYCPKTDELWETFMPNEDSTSSSETSV